MTSRPTENRANPLAVSAENATTKTIAGLVVPYGTRSLDMGGWVECFEPRAFAKSEGDGFPGVVCSWEHQTDQPPLGTTAAKTLRLTNTDKGTWLSHVEQRWAKVAVAEVQTSGVRSWVQDMVAAGAGPATVENALSVLRQVLALAVEDKRLARNPCAGVKARAGNIGHAAT